MTSTKNEQLAVWRSPDCPMGEWALGLEAGRTLRVIKHFATKGEALNALAALER